MNFENYTKCPYCMKSKKCTFCEGVGWVKDKEAAHDDSKRRADTGTQEVEGKRGEKGSNGVQVVLEEKAGEMVVKR